MTPEEEEFEYQRTHGNPLQGVIGLAFVVLMISAIILLIVVPGVILNEYACFMFPQFCR